MNHISHSAIKLFAFFWLLTISMNAWTFDAGAGKCQIRISDAVIVWQAIDNNSGNQIIQGAVGLLASDPSTWSVTTLSASMGGIQHSAPALFSNANGDIVVLWQYSDENANFHVAAAVLPAETTTWNSTTISNNTKIAGSLDQTASIDALGNILVIWTAIDPISNESQIRGAKAKIVLGTVSWSEPFTMSP